MKVPVRRPNPPASSGRPEQVEASATGPEVRPGRWRRHRVTIAFLAPAAILLGIWIVYPTIYTIVRSLFDRDGTEFVGLDNYGEIFSTDILVTAIRNNAIWLAVVPALVTAIGLIFGVLIERIRWSLAFRIAELFELPIEEIFGSPYSCRWRSRSSRRA